MDQKPRKKIDIQDADRPILIDGLTFQISLALLSNPMVYPANNDEGILRMAVRFRQAMTDSGLATSASAPLKL